MFFPICSLIYAPKSINKSPLFQAIAITFHRFKLLLASCQLDDDKKSKSVSMFLLRLTCKALSRLPQCSHVDIQMVLSGYYFTTHDTKLLPFFRPRAVFWRAKASVIICKHSNTREGIHVV